MSLAYYNEIDPKAAAWLRELIRADLIAPGDVDERSIEDVAPNELAGYTQHHFFAGIGGWSYALRLAGWPDDKPVWTGSCPCQPFSAAGKGAGFADERHLWPAFQHLIAQRRPPVVLGEQVASKVADGWIDLVHADLEGMGYAFGCVAFPSAGIGAPHIRDRTYWVGNAPGVGCAGRGQPDRSQKQSHGAEAPIGGGVWQQAPQRGFVGGFWRDAEWIGGFDGFTRPVEPGTQPLVDGLPTSLVRLRDCERIGLEEIERYGATHSRNPDEVLRMVRDAVCQIPSRQEQETGMCGELPEAEVLLAFLLSLQSAREASDNGRGFKEAGGQAHRRGVRSLRVSGAPGDPPRQWRPDEQLRGEPANPLFALSLVLARHAHSYREAAKSAYAATGRLRRLRGYGNAINPIQAAAFIEAVMASIDTQMPTRLTA